MRRILTALFQMHIPIKNAWQLNERHYGALTGLDKQETVEKHGKDKVTQTDNYVTATLY